MYIYIIDHHVVKKKEKKRGMEHCFTLTWSQSEVLRRGKVIILGSLGGNIGAKLYIYDAMHH